MPCGVQGLLPPCSLWGTHPLWGVEKVTFSQIVKGAQIVKGEAGGRRWDRGRPRGVLRQALD